MFRLVTTHLTNVARGVVQNSYQRCGFVARPMSSQSETDEEFDARYEAYFNRPDIDGWEIRKAMNDLAGMDLVPEPKIVTAALKACRRVNDYALSVRFLETVKFKTGGRNEIYEYVMNEIKPTLEELGIDTPEKLGYDKPEMALQDIYDIH